MIGYIMNVNLSTLGDKELVQLCMKYTNAVLSNDAFIPKK